MRVLIICSAIFAFATSPSWAQTFVLENTDSDGNEGILFVNSETEDVSFFPYNTLLENGDFADGVIADPISGLAYFSQDGMLYSLDPANGTVNFVGREPNVILREKGFTGAFVYSGIGAASAFNQSQFGVSQVIQTEIDSSSAIASALSIELPSGDSQNRVGLTSGAFGNEQAFGVSYARVQGRFDVGLAYAQGDGGRNAGKVSVGFSW
ncbi:MAG: hypothetical protein ACFE0P_00465 [Oceanicaulis sp.]